jgi:hypothetical protein
MKYMTERVIRVIGCDDCPNHFCDSGDHPMIDKNTGHCYWDYCLATNPHKEVCGNDVPDWCPLEEIGESEW